MKKPKIIGIYLAAGKSSRMGKSKLDLPVGNLSLGSKALQEALRSDFDFTIVISREGDLLKWLFPFATKGGWGYLKCKDENIGQSISIKAGLKVAMNCRADAVVILLADQPFVTSDGINRLITEFKGNSEVAFVASTNIGVIKPPILFAKSLFFELQSLEGDKGARSLLRGKWKKQGKKLEYEHKYFIDVDTCEDYSIILKGLEGSM
ncbi:MAG: nucleotidyltransferase family protein [Bacillota bacterium]|nr:nucleotidyltransferase family protein [Bacillota bacterium]